MNPRSKSSNDPLSSPPNTILEFVWGISRASRDGGGIDSSPSGGVGKRSPRLIEATADCEENEEMTSPDDTSHSLIVESSDEETMFRPRSTMAVSVTVRVWARRVRTGATLVPFLDGTSGRSAGSIVSEKSMPEVSSTREDGKNLSDVTPLKWGFDGVRDAAMSISCETRVLRGCSSGDDVG